MYMMNKIALKEILKNFQSFFPLLILIIILWLIQFNSYPLFHTLVEMFCVIIAGGVFIVAWDSRKFADNSYILFLGVALFFIGLTDLLHLMAYKGINVFNSTGNNLPTQLWIAGRLLEAASLIIAPFYSAKKLAPRALFSVYLLATAALLTSIFYFNTFPAAYVDGIGLTPFKIYSEYIAMAGFALAAFLLYREGKIMERRLVIILSSAIITKIFSELMFTLYVDVFSLANFLGHIFKLISYYLFYIGIIESALTRPYEVLFKNLKNSETFLKDSEQRYRALIEYAPNAILLHLNGLITYINPAGLALLGAEHPEQIIGRNLLDFIDQNFKNFMKSRTETIYLGTKFVPVAEIKIITLSGKTVEVDCADSLTNIQGKFAGQLIMHDITLRKNVERELAQRAKKIEDYAHNLKKFRLAVENASDSIIITDPRLKIIYANQAAEAMTGYSVNEMVEGLTPLSWLDKEKNKDGEEKILGFCQNYEKFTPGEPCFTREIVNRKKDNSLYVAAINISPVSDENKKIIFFVVIEHDITKLKEIDRAKTEFVSLASHQLRTPLSSISLSTELILRGIAGPVEDKQKKYLLGIYNASKKMKELIESLLNISRIELGTFMIKPEIINLPEAIDEILKEQIMNINNKKLEFTKKLGNDLPSIMFDKNILNITLDNLMANAIRYTPSGGRVTLKVERLTQEILISVTDTGCGIPKNQQAKVFQKSFRADNAKEISAEGAGLGLYMARSILNKAGGKIWFESSEDRGSTFFITIPIKEVKN